MSADLSQTCFPDRVRCEKPPPAGSASLDTDIKDRQWLLESADALVAASGSILAATRKISTPPWVRIDRRRAFDPIKLVCRPDFESIATGLREIAALKDPIGEVARKGSRVGRMSDRETTRGPSVWCFFIYEKSPQT